MKRSILLAICDFLILSALSLTSGVKQYHNPVEHLNPSGNIELGQQLELTPDESWKSEFKVTDERIHLIKAQREINRLSDSELKLETEKLTALKDIAQRNENIKALESVNRVMISKNTDLAAKIDHDKALIRNIDSIVQDLSGTNEKLNSELKVKTFRIDNLGQINSELSNVNKQLTGNISAKDKQIEILGDRTNIIKESFSELESVIENKDKILQQVKRASQAIEQENTTLEGRLQTQTAKLAGERVSNETITAQHNALKIQLDEVQLAHTEGLQRKKHELLQKDNTLEDTLREMKRKDDELQRLEIKLAKLSQGNGYVWEKYSSSSVKFSVTIKEDSSMNPRPHIKTGFLPEINVDGQSYLISEFNSLGFGWDKIARNMIHTLEVVVGDKKRINTPIQYLTSNPKICLIPTSSTPSDQAVSTIGYSTLLKRGLDDIYLFKKNGNSSELKCYFSAAEPGFIFTKNASSASTTLSASPGDYLLTKTGKLIGVFVSHSKCYIIPNNLSNKLLSPIPITKDSGSKYFTEFSKTVKLLQKK